MIIPILDDVNLNIDDPLNPIIEVSPMPIYVVREEEYTSSTKLNPDEYLFETTEKSFRLYNSFSTRFTITSVNRETFIQELSTLYRIKKKCIKQQEYRFVYNHKTYYYIKAVFFVMEDKYYYSWKAKYRDMKIQQILT